MGVRDSAPMWDDIVGLADQGFESAVIRLAEIKLEMAKLEVEEKDLAASIEAMLIVTDQKRVRWQDKFCVERANGRSPASINGQLLVEQGVSTEIIAAATKPGKPYTYVQIVDMEKNKQPKGEGPAVPND